MNDLEKEKARLISQKIAETVQAGEAVRARGSQSAQADVNGDGLTYHEALRLARAVKLVEDTRRDRPEALARFMGVYADVLSTVNGQAQSKPVGWSK